MSSAAVGKALIALFDELGTLKWAGADEGWEHAIRSVRAEILARAQKASERVEGQGA